MKKLILIVLATNLLTASVITTIYHYYRINEIQQIGDEMLEACEAKINELERSK